MEIIRDHLPAWDATLACIILPVDRLTLARRRWRGTAGDGAEFGFDLEHPLADGDVFFQNDAACYRVAQQPEPVLAVLLSSPLDAAQTGWKIGNLHFQIAVTAKTLFTLDDLAIRQMLERERIAHWPTHMVFKPLGGSHSHGPPPAGRDE